MSTRTGAHAATPLASVSSASRTVRLFSALRRLLCPLLCLLLCVALAGCGSKSWRKGGTPGTKPYKVKGKTYYPLKSAHGFVEEGVASWYGPGFHGKTTANGERYNQYGMTAAHKILPLGTTVKVTNLRTRKSVNLRINDRGPFADDRVIDLSRTAAEKLGIIAAGTGRVRIESVGTLPQMRDDGDLDGDFFVQLGSFGVEANARRLAEKVKDMGFDSRVKRATSGDMWHVQAGPWKDLFAAQKALPQLLKEFRGAFVVGD